MHYCVCVLYSIGRGREMSGEVGKLQWQNKFQAVCIFCCIIVCVLYWVGGGRSGRSAEEDESTLVSSFFKKTSLGQSQVRGSLTRLGLARLGLAHFQNFSDKKKGWWYCGNALARRCRFMRSVGNVGRGVRVDLGIKLFQEPSLGQSQVRGSLTRLGLARLVSSRLGSFPKFLR